MCSGPAVAGVVGSALGSVSGGATVGGAADGLGDRVAVGPADLFGDGRGDRVADGGTESVADGPSDRVADGTSDGVADGASDRVADGLGAGSGALLDAVVLHPVTARQSNSAVQPAAWRGAAPWRALFGGDTWTARQSPVSGGPEGTDGT